MDKIKTEFINLQTDFGFKKLYGSDANKNILIGFLNALFAGKLTVHDVEYHNVEILPSEEEGKRIVYDVFCTSDINYLESPFYPIGYRKKNKEDKNERTHHFIVEMQNYYVPPFEERIVYYASKTVADQGEKGWNYDLNPVITIAITDFNFSHMRPKLVHDVMFMDRETGEALTDKVHLMFCSLKELPGTWEECKTELERRLFLIKNMDLMTTTSAAYLDGRYLDMFEAARSNRLSHSDIVAYSQSLEKFREIQTGYKYAEEKALAKGIEIGEKRGMEIGEKRGMEIGEKRGMEIGRMEEKRQMVRNMMERQLPIKDIAAIAGMSEEEVKELQDGL